VPLVGKELTLIPDEFAALYFNFESADVLKDYDIVQCAPYTIRLTRKDRQIKAHGDRTGSVKFHLAS